MKRGDCGAMPLVEQPLPHCFGDGRRAIADSEFLVQALHMGFDCRRRYVQLSCDRRDALASSNTIEYLALSCAEHWCGRRCALADLPSEPTDKRGRDHITALRAIEHRLDDLGARRILEQEARGALLQRLVHDRRLIVSRNQQHAGRQFVASHRRRHLRAIHAGHPVVQQRHIGEVRLDQLQRGRAVVCLADDVHRAAQRKRPYDALTKERVIVANNHTHFFRRRRADHGDEFSGSPARTVLRRQRRTSAGFKSLPIRGSPHRWVWLLGARVIPVRRPACSGWAGTRSLYGKPAILAGPRHEYGSIVVSRYLELERVRKVHQLRSFRIASVLRVGVVGLMVAAMLIGTRRSEWPQQTGWIVLYSLIAILALALASAPFRRRIGTGRMVGVGGLEPIAFIVLDVVMLTGFQLLSTDGIYPLLIMTLLPILLGLDVSSRRAAVMLVFSMVGFAIAVLEDPEMVDRIGWSETVFRFVLYAFLCGTAFVVVRIEERHTHSVAGLSALREELLAQTMTASEVLQRRISEAIHDGPLQDILAVRQELVELDTTLPDDDRVGRALVGLQTASERLRQATFELHPAVLEQVGLGAAVEQLAAFTALRSGIEVSTDIDYPVRSANDPIVFGVVRELLSNVMQHSQARHASVTLGITDEVCVLDVADDGVGVTGETMARRLGEGHIGLASHRARVDAAGGVFFFLDTPAGTHVCVELPLK